KEGATVACRGSRGNARVSRTRAAPSTTQRLPLQGATVGIPAAGVKILVCAGSPDEVRQAPCGGWLTSERSPCSYRGGSTLPGGMLQSGSRRDFVFATSRLHVISGRLSDRADFQALRA